jgi:hypothetical protein
MPLFLRVHPGGRDYRLPREDEAAEVIKSVAAILGTRDCVVIGYDLPEQPSATAVVILNGNVVESVDLIDVPGED